MSFGIDGRQIVRSDRWQPRSKPLSKRNGDIYVVPHHAYNYTRTQTIDTFNNPNRFVSANLAIGPLEKGGVYGTIETVPVDTGRAATTSSSIDDQAITFEMSNVSLVHPYVIGDTGKAAFVDVLVDAHLIYGMPLIRGRVLSHRDVYNAGWGSYATACPGDDLQAYIPVAIDLAKRRVAAGGGGGGTIETPEQEEYDMAKNSGIYWKRAADGKTEYMVFNPESGFRANHSGTDGAYNNALAAALGTGSWAGVSEGHARVFIAELDAIQASKASGTIDLRTKEPIDIDLNDVVEDQRIG